MNFKAKKNFGKSFLLFSAIISPIVFASACQNSKVKPVCYSDFLTENQINSLTKKANEGDTEAAVKLSRFYFDVKPDRGEEIKWLVKAAKNGDVGSQYNLGVLYAGDVYSATTDLAKAKYWFQKAADNGVVEAKRKLDAMQMKEP